MTLKIRRIREFKDKVFGSCVDIVCQSAENNTPDIIHFIFPDDEYYLSAPRFAFSLNAVWEPNLNDFTFDFITELFEFPKLETRNIAKGFIHKGFYIDTRAPFEFYVRSASRVVDEYYSHIVFERDVFNCPRRIASELCLVRTTQYKSERIRPNSDINEPIAKSVSFLFPLNEELLRPIFLTKEHNELWKPNPILFSFDKYTKIINDDFDFPEYKARPVLVYDTLTPNLRWL